jgi:hypothetical protein
VIIKIKTWEECREIEVIQETDEKTNYWMVGGWNRIYKPNIQLFIVQKEEVFNVE